MNYCFFGIIFNFYLNLIDGLLLTLPLIIIIGLILKQINKSIKFWSNERIINNENLISMNYNFINGIKELFYLVTFRNYKISNQKLLKLKI